MAFQAWADYQDHAIGWLKRGYSSFGSEAVVPFPRIWMSSGECRLKALGGGARFQDLAQGLAVVRGVLMDADNLALGREHEWPIPSRQTGINGHASDRCSIVLPSWVVGSNHLGNPSLEHGQKAP